MAVAHGSSIQAVAHGAVAHGRSIQALAQQQQNTHAQEAQEAHDDIMDGRFHRDRLGRVPNSSNGSSTTTTGFMTSHHHDSAATGSSATVGDQAVSRSVGGTRGGMEAKRRVQGVQPTLAIAFAEGLREEVDTLRQVGAAKGWGEEYTEFMITNASAWLEKDRRLKEAWATEQWFPHLLTPGAVVSDGGQGIRGAFNYWWPNVQQYGDYAHIYFLFAEGRYLAKNHVLYEWIKKEVIPEMHTCQTKGAWDVMRQFLARQWKTDPVLMGVHARLFGRDVNPWFIGICLIAGCIPSQNCHEVCVNALRVPHSPT